jgi:hypothetical protein
VSFQTARLTMLIRLSAVIVALTVLAGCGGGSSSGGSSPAITLSPTSITFSIQSVGTTSAPQSITVTDSGTATLTFTSIAVSGDYAQTNNCGTSLGAGGSCTISVTFTPSSSGARTGAVTITDNASGSPHTVSLTGTGAVPTVSVSPSSLAFGNQTLHTSSSPLPVNVQNTGASTLTITSIVVSGDFSQTNNCGTGVGAGGSCTINVTFAPTGIGTRNGALTITDNAGNSPQTVNLTGTGAGSSVSLSTNTLTFAGVAVGSVSSPQSVTLSNTSNAALAISGISASEDFSQTNNCGSSLVAGGSCTINVTFAPTANGTRTGILTVTDNAEGVSGSTQTVSLTGTTLSNMASVTVSFGPNGNTGSPANNYYNGIYTTVAVCTPGTTNCVSIPDVLVDTGSVGLRVLSTQLSGLTLPQVSDTSGNNLYECTQYGDLSYTWGPIQYATVQVGGETALQVPGGSASGGIPIQVISAPGTGIAVPNIACARGGGPDNNTVQVLGANGILGVGNYTEDCGSACASQYTAASVSPYPYWLCNTSNCGAAIVPESTQVWNPVAAFSSTNTNGLVIQLPSIPAAGQATVSGTMIFGIGTQTNNTIPNTATIYGLDQYGNFSSTVFGGLTYTSAGFIDSGTNSLTVSDHATLTSVTGVNTVDCTDNGFYCPASTLSLNITNYGSNGTQGTVTINIANADALFSNNSNFAAFNNLGTDSGTSPTTDQFDLGLPFFFGRTVFIGIAGTSTGGITYPNGFWAY